VRRKPAIFIISFLFICSCLQAQREFPSHDTIVTYFDTIPTDSETVTDYEIVDEDDNENYFLPLTSPEWEEDSVHMRKLSDSLVTKLQNDDDFWYANANLQKKKQDAKLKKSFTSSSWFQTLLWLIIIGGFAGFVIWYLAGSNVGLFRKKTAIIRTEDEEDLNTEDIFAINYQKEIDKAAQSGNYRLAIRLLFLRLLKDLSRHNIIQYKQDKTNLDYLMQLHTTRYYNDFFRITRNYEYSWYGHFDVNENAYQIIRKDFENFDYRLK
jgi:hypothetical protein